MKDLLVSVDDSENCSYRLAVVQNLASRFDSHVTGIHVSRIMSDLDLYDVVTNELTIKNLQSQLANERDTVTDQFYRSLSLGTGKTSFFSEQSNDKYLQLAKINDLIVISQPTPEQRKHMDFVSQLIMRSGRPILLLPYTNGNDEIGSSVMVAWDDSREACRAVHDALPLLKAAKTVHVVSVSEPSKLENTTPSATISEHLARHDVNVITHDVVKNDIPVAESLLSLTADYNIDLLVMGGYGHSRMREFVFGGVTKTILGSMTVPVLMAH